MEESRPSAFYGIRDAAFPQCPGVSGKSDMSGQPYTATPARWSFVAGVVPEFSRYFSAPGNSSMSSITRKQMACPVLSNVMRRQRLDRGFPFHEPRRTRADLRVPCGGRMFPVPVIRRGDNADD